MIREEVYRYVRLFGLVYSKITNKTEREIKEICENKIHHIVSRRLIIWITRFLCRGVRYVGFFLKTKCRLQLQRKEHSMQIQYCKCFFVTVCIRHDDRSPQRNFAIALACSIHTHEWLHS